MSLSPKRVEIPRSVLPHFSLPEVHIRIENAAQLLGFPGEKELRAYTGPLWKKFDGAEPLLELVSASSFNRLVILCAAKTPNARKLLEELSTCWAALRTGKETVEVPASITPRDVVLGKWPGCTPESVGMDPAPFDRIRQYFQWRTRMRHFAGIACGVVRNGRMVFYQDSGYANAETKQKMSGDTLVRLFSMTKCLVSVAFMTYLEDPAFGVDLDDPLSKYIPAFAAEKMTVLPKRGQKEPQPCLKPITLRQLLTHTSGIGYGATLDDPWPPAKGSYYKIYEDLCEGSRSGRIKSLQEWCECLAKIPLKGQPGHFWDYSYSLDVVGRVLEVIAGKGLDAVLEERVTGPLKMRDTGFAVKPENASRLGPWYKSVEQDGKPNLAHNLEVVDKGGLESGWVGSNVSSILSGGGTVEVPLAMKGGMVSTFNDYMRFLIMLKNFGELDGVRVLRRETVQMMICNHIPTACYGKKSVFVFDKPGVGYSCLGQIQGAHPKQDKGTCSGEYGWGGLAGPAFTIDPRSDLIVLSMTQTAFVLDHEEYLRYTARRSIHQYIYGAVAAPAKATSYPPDSFDVAAEKRIPKEGPKDDKDKDKDKEFEEEYVVLSKTRQRTAKERAICPGPRLDRHPSEEDPLPPHLRELEEPEATPAAKRRRSTGGGEEGAPSGNHPGGRGQSAASPSKPPPGSSPANSENGLLFSRVAVKNKEEDGPQKARVTGVAGSSVEVVTEKDFVTRNVSIHDLNVIDESQMGIPNQAASGGPVDFSFLLKDGQSKSA